jgi:DNA-directed RNA polymerase II subunit RPB7
MVFFRKRMRRVVHIEAKYLGKDLRLHIHEQCRLEAVGSREATTSGLGFVVVVLGIEDDFIGSGVIDHLTGKVRYEVEYDAIVFRPFKHEVLDATVKMCSNEGIFAGAGPLDLFISRLYIPPEYSFRPEDGAWAHGETGTVIRGGTDIRAKILGVNASGNVAAIAAINEPFLGPLA